MTTRSEIYNGGAYGRTVFQAINKTATAGGGGDNAEVNGSWADRMGASGIALSAKLIIVFTAALAAGETLKFAGNFQDATSIAGANAADFEAAFASSVAATGASGGSTETGTAEIDINLEDARQFIRAQITPDMSRGATDTVEWTALIQFYGDQRGPDTQALASIGHATKI